MDQAEQKWWMQLSMRTQPVPARGSALFAELAARGPDTTNVHKKDRMSVSYTAREFEGSGLG